MLKNKPVLHLAFSHIVLVLLVALLALATKLSAAASGGRAARARQPGQAGSLMTQTQTAAAHHVGIPQLDMTIPAQIETATFALG